MALTRSFLKGMGLTEEQVSAIVEANSESIEGVKEERDRYKKAAESIPALEKKIKALENADGENWEERYNKEHEAFESYKKDMDAKAEREAVKSAYRELLKAENVSEKRIDKILKLTDLDSLKLTKEGKIANEEKVAESIRSEWSDFIVSQSDRGTDVDNPPAAGGKSMTKEQIMAIKDTSKRQQAISENLELFGY